MVARSGLTIVSPPQSGHSRSISVIRLIFRYTLGSGETRVLTHRWDGIKGMMESDTVLLTAGQNERRHVVHENGAADSEGSLALPVLEGFGVIVKLFTS